MIINAKRLLAILVLALLVVAGMFGIRWAVNAFYQNTYPREYSEWVEGYAAEYGIDPKIVYAVIKTESDFVPNATSNVGARGLMQIMETTYNWIKTKLPEAEGTYADMYDPEENIRYGAFFLSYLYREFGSYETAVAAYHAGRTATANWLKDEQYSKDGVTLDHIPSGDTGHYVSKVMDCYQHYQAIYPES